MSIVKCAKCGVNVEYALLDEPGVKINFKGWYGQHPTKGEIHFKGKRRTLCPSCTSAFEKLFRGFIREQ